MRGCQSVVMAAIGYSRHFHLFSTGGRQHETRKMLIEVFKKSASEPQAPSPIRALGCSVKVSLKMLLHLHVLVALLVGVHGDTRTYHNYTRETGCYAPADSTLVKSNCMDPREPRSFLHCISLCSANEWCRGVVKDAKAKCYYYSPCSYLKLGSSCRPEDTEKVNVYRKPGNVSVMTGCGAGGKYNPGNKTCSCQPGWSGVYCDTAARSCEDAKTSGSFWIDLRLANVVRTQCEVSSGEYKLHAFKNDGRSYHNRSWQDYVRGYRIDDSNFWLGLDNMHYVINRITNTLRIEVSFVNSSYSLIWDYQGVYITSAQFHYTITDYLTMQCRGNPNSFCGYNIPKCLIPGVSFSTIDRDNDPDLLDDLAKTADAGWWFQDTSILFGNKLICNPLGRLPSELAARTNKGKLILPGLDTERGEYMKSFQHVSMYFYK
ncbi:unnamed protein product [Lymnaea stagnalis]|uniref:Fibrinogen C-terminal domain-containing protein n=1 Tax=Lymnaea stagnalis TaxID=6523 RepID=A0AAV2HU76_LYMST